MTYMDVAIERWCQALESGEYAQTTWAMARDRNGSPVSARNPDAVCFCVLGVAEKIGLDPRDLGDVRTVAMHLNDFGGYTFTEIAARIRRVEYVK